MASDIAPLRCPRCGLLSAERATTCPNCGTTMEQWREDDAQIIPLTEKMRRALRRAALQDGVSITS